MQYFTVKFCTIPYSIGKKVNVFNLFTLNSFDITTPNQAYVVRDSLHGPCSVQYYTGIYHRTDKQQVEPNGARTPALCSMSLVVLKQLFGMVVIMRKDFQLYTVLIISKQQLKTMECVITNL